MVLCAAMACMRLRLLAPALLTMSLQQLSNTAAAAPAALAAARPHVLFMLADDLVCASLLTFLFFRFFCSDITPQWDVVALCLDPHVARRSIDETCARPAHPSLDPDSRAHAHAHAGLRGRLLPLEGAEPGE